MLPEIDVEAFAARLDEGDPALVVDVREVEEYLPGHVPGAVNLPLSRLTARTRELPRDRRVYLVCRSGRRSLQATALLRGIGVDAINVAGGTDAWLASGRQVEPATR